jgi:AP endonuclease-2
MLDSEGRCVILEFPAFVIFGIYSPANSNGERDDFRYGFLNALDMRIRNLIQAGKSVVVTGDLNVSRNEMDTANAFETMKKEGISHEQYISTPNRRIFNQLLEGGEVFGERDEGREEPAMWDICRGFHPDRRGMFTHWEQKINARPGNFGSRIDFILCSLDMKSWFLESNTQDGLMGSDHCPVYAVAQDEVEVLGRKRHVLDIMNPAGYFQDGKRVKEYSVRDVPAFSGKLMPEFDKRRTIKDMFSRKPTLTPSASLDIATTPEAVPAFAETALTTATSKAATPPPVSVPPADSPFSVSSQVTTVTSNASPAAKPATKRSASDTQSTKSSKRAKSTTSKAASSASTQGQQSLKGFFKPKATAAQHAEPTAEPSSTAQAPAAFSFKQDQLASTTPLASIISTPPASLASTDATSPSFPTDDPIASKESWSRLFTKPVGPRCEHDEPCKIMKTKKPGFNCGREFWMCTRPLGPSGQKEKGTEWRCGTFIWSSDLRGEGNGTAEREF